MIHGFKKILAIGIPLVCAAAVAFAVQGNNIAVLNPKGDIASQQRTLIIVATAIMLLVVIPVFVLTFYIARKYREGQKIEDYQPDLDGNRALEIVWWTIPLSIVIVLGGIIWKTSHTLDPYRPIASDRKPITVQVVSLEWKWLFIYPEQGLATVNYLQIPEDTPINFELTSDAPMNSFWIPQLGGQVYTMNGMQTKLHLIANEPGEYTGQSANLSGEGFAGMKFTTKATSTTEFESWVKDKQSSSPLDASAYDALAKRSKNNPPTTYRYKDRSIYANVINKYMAPEGSDSGHHHGN